MLNFKSIVDFVYSKIKGHPRRSERRFGLGREFICKAYDVRQETSFMVFPCDVSQRGASFITRKPFSIEEEILLEFKMDEQSFGPFRGKIRSQDIFYYSPEKALEHSLFRFSIQFDEPIEKQNLTDLTRAIS